MCIQHHLNYCDQRIIIIVKYFGTTAKFTDISVQVSSITTMIL